MLSKGILGTSNEDPPSPPCRPFPDFSLASFLPPFPVTGWSGAVRPGSCEGCLEGCCWGGRGLKVSIGRPLRGQKTKRLLEGLQLVPWGFNWTAPPGPKNEEAPGGLLVGVLGLQPGGPLRGPKKRRGSWRGCSWGLEVSGSTAHPGGAVKVCREGVLGLFGWISRGFFRFFGRGGV